MSDLLSSPIVPVVIGAIAVLFSSPTKDPRPVWQKLLDVVRKPTTPSIPGLPSVPGAPSNLLDLLPLAWSLVKQVTNRPPPTTDVAQVIDAAPPPSDLNDLIKRLFELANVTVDPASPAISVTPSDVDADVAQLVRIASAVKAKHPDSDVLVEITDSLKVEVTPRTKAELSATK